jgi:hypothetical protein
MRQAADVRWNAHQKSDPIFQGFIDNDRDLLLKQYDFCSVAQNVTVKLGDATTVTTYEMLSPPFHGQQPRDVVQNAIKWWERELTEVEKEAERLSQSSV